MNQELSMSPNLLVAALQKPASEFTKADIVSYIKENDIRMVNFMSQIVGKHACGHVPAFIGGDGYEQVGFSHSHFFQAFYGGRGGCSRHQVEVGVQCAQLLFVVVHQNDVLLLAGQQFGQVCAYCAGTCNNYFHF